MSNDVMTMRHTTIGFLVALALSLLAAMPRRGPASGVPDAAC